MQKTYTPKKQDLEPKWFIIDAEGKVLGKIATLVADTLRGKNKPIFTPHMDCGDFVIIINAEKVTLTGNKLDQKMYYSHSGYKGGLKTVPARKMLAEKPTKILQEAIKSMLPKNRLQKTFMNKLKLYVGAEHPHEAQQPTPLEVK
ncbi:50S ribosomal protein L13 [Candidatus Peregrinibacteria bacterium]|jgi:large subunit ribosomal protein L13|nr:50S ribosomal protein L13 [Candidatus Peregrinibacteria bacterium]MBT4055915.1 50S ribosomal protein L13 [Candidatus Peregrinibacteria bacterium]